MSIKGRESVLAALFAGKLKRAPPSDGRARFSLPVACCTDARTGYRRTCASGPRIPSRAAASRMRFRTATMAS